MNSDTPFRHAAVIGRGRLGTALAHALRASGHAVEGPLGRGEGPSAEADVLLLCVPDAEIAPLAAGLPLGPLVGHCSGASGLDVLHPHEAFSLHPLMTLTGDAVTGAQRLNGAGAAIAATSDRALSVARALAEALGLRPFELAEEDRATYHAAATLASNFLVTLEGVAERLAAAAGVPREVLLPLVRASVENWAALGAERALTGPIARGDEATVTRQRAAIAERDPALLDLFDELCRATRELAGALR